MTHPYRRVALAALLPLVLAAPAAANVVVLSPERGLSAGAVAADAKGRLLVGGALESSDRMSRFGLARLSRSGRLDRGFGRKGFAIAQVDRGSFEDLTSVVALPDGRVLTLGGVETGEMTTDGVEGGDNAGMATDIHFGFARFTGSGSLEARKVVPLAGGGVVETPFWMIPRPGGGIFAGGDLIAGSRSACVTALDDSLAFVASFETSCRIPPGFGDAGFVDGEADRDGVVVAMNASGQGGGRVDRFGIGRFRADGSPDPGFGDGGFAATDFGADPSDTVRGSRALARRPGGGWLVAGTTPRAFGFAAFTAAGAVDTGYGSAGKLETDVDGTSAVDSLRTVVEQPDGGVVAVGQIDGKVSNPKAGKLLLTRVTPSGALDRSFGRGGRVVIGGAKLGLHLRGVAGAVAQGRSTVVVATALVLNRRRQWQDGAVVVRIKPNGKLDRRFGR